MAKETERAEEAPRRAIPVGRTEEVEFAVRETCTVCGKGFWSWPSRPATKCGGCLWRRGVGYQIPRTESP